MRKTLRALATRGVVFAMVVMMVLSNVFMANAATYIFSQTNWSGGATTNNAAHNPVGATTTGWTQFSIEGSSVVASAESVKLGFATSTSVTHTDNTANPTGFGFGAEAYSVATTTGSGTSTSIILGSYNSFAPATTTNSTSNVASLSQQGGWAYGSSTNLTMTGTGDAASMQLNSQIGQISYTSKWGSAGTGNGQWNNPTGIAVDASGNIYIADTNNNRIQKFNSSGTFQWWLGYDGSTVGTHTTGTGFQGSADGRFWQPRGVAVDASGNIYVVDTENNRIQKFNSSGVFVTKWGVWGQGDGQFISPRGIAADTSGNVYVADFGNYRIQKFNSSGAFVTKWGSYGNGNGQFNAPQGIAVDTNGNVYVADGNIQKFNSSGTFVAAWNYGGGYIDSSVNGVGVDTNNNVYVSFSGYWCDEWDPVDEVCYAGDGSDNWVKKFNSSGTELSTVGPYTTPGAADGQFNTPRSAVRISDSIYVLDAGNSRVQKFTDQTAIVTYSASGTYTSYIDGESSSIIWNNFAWDGTFQASSAMSFKIVGTNSTTQPLDATFAASQCSVSASADGIYEFNSTCSTSLSGNRYLWYRATLASSADRLNGVSLDTIAVNTITGTFYYGSGTYTSGIIDTGSAGAARWDSIGWTTHGGQTISLKVRTDANGTFDEAGEPTWAFCGLITPMFWNLFTVRRREE